MRIHLSGLVLLVVFLQQAMAVHAQDKITLRLKRASLVELLQQIRQQTGLDYTIRQEYVSKFAPIDVDFRDISVEVALQHSLKGQPLTFRIQNNTIIIQETTSQQRYISGVVTDQEKRPLTGASVSIQGTNIQTRTNQRGEFELFNIPQQPTLIITYIGYERRVIDLGDNVGALGELFVLKQQIGELEEVKLMANTGYQKLDPSKATGSMVLLSSEDLKKSPALSLTERIEGLTPGVRVDLKTNKLMVRSPNTFTATSSPYGLTGGEPLIVIDGFPALNQRLVQNPTGTGDRMSADIQSASILNNFNPNDIESITILKDAAATSIWGSRAANGVIVIETKAGKRGESSVNYSTTFSTSRPADLNKLRTMNAVEYIEFEKELFDNNFFSDPSQHWRYTNVSEAQQVMFMAQRDEITEMERDALLSEIGQRNNKKQIQDYLLQSAQTQQHNLSLNGRVGSATYYAALSYANDRPIYKENSAKNYDATINLSNTYLQNKLTVSLGFNQSYQKSNVNDVASSAITPGALALTPYDMLVDGNGDPIRRYYMFTPDVAQSRFEDKGYLSWSYNPIDDLPYNNDKYDNNLSRLTADLKFRATTWLSASLSGSYQKGLRTMESLKDRDSYEMRNLINEGTTFDALGRPVYGVPNGGKMYTSNTKSEDYSVRFQLDANKKWNDLHQLNIIAGSEIRQLYSMGYTQTRYGFDRDSYQSTVINPAVPYKDIYGGNKYLTPQDAPINVSKIRYLSYYANGGYTLMDRYYATGSVRFDDATIIGIERSKRAVPLWSAGLRWDLHKETFLQSTPWLNALSLRGSIGTGGSMPSDASALPLYQASVIDTYTLLPTGSLSGPANQMLGWETTKTYNAGLEATLLANRLNLSLDIYKKKSYGILANVPYNATYGWSSLWFNTGNMKSNGFELMVAGDIIKKKDWQWNSSFNIAYSDNEVTDDRLSVQGTPVGTTSTIIEGYPIDYLFAYRWAGLDDKGRSQISDAQGKVYTTDDAVTDLTIDDVRYMGRTTAPYFGGWSNTVSYKGFSLITKVSMYFGHKVLRKEINSSQYPNGTSFSGFLSNSKLLVDRWRKPGDEAFTDIPGVINTNFNNISRYANADINVLDGSHIRFQQITLNYNIPTQSLFRSRKIVKSATIGATVGNIGLLWKKTKEDIDPEYMFDGNYRSMPPVRNYSFSLNVNF